MTTKDFWVDGHYIFADTAVEARVICHHIYGHMPETVRPWTDEDQAELEWQVADHG